jgi:hypothetical protein
MGLQDRSRLPAAGQAACPSDHLRLLIVDDYPDAADSFALLLRLWGHEVYLVFDSIQSDLPVV